LPISLIKGRKRIDVEREDVENRLVASKERQRVLESSYIGRTMPSRERRELEELQDEQR
jgi:LMBR1 domain-containing protein 1